MLLINTDIVDFKIGGESGVVHYAVCFWIKPAADGKIDNQIKFLVKWLGKESFGSTPGQDPQVDMLL